VKIGARDLVSFALYVTYGALGTLAHYVVLILAVAWWHIDAVLASMIGALVGAIVNYLLNYRYTFNSDLKHGVSAPRYFMVALLGLGLNGLFMEVLVHALKLHYLVSQVIASLVLLFVTYLANSRWSFHDASDCR
jgi:putative flippase GtrA